MAPRFERRRDPVWRHKERAMTTELDRIAVTSGDPFPLHAVLGQHTRGPLRVRFEGHGWIDFRHDAPGVRVEHLQNLPWGRGPKVIGATITIHDGVVKLLCLVDDPLAAGSHYYVYDTGWHAVAG